MGKISNLPAIQFKLETNAYEDRTDELDDIFSKLYLKKEGEGELKGLLFKAGGVSNFAKLEIFGGAETPADLAKMIKIFTEKSINIDLKIITK